MEEKKKIEDELCQPSTSKSAVDTRSCHRDIVTKIEPYPNDESEDEVSFTSSWGRSFDFATYRARLGTGHWLDKKEEALKSTANVKDIEWNDPSTSLTSETVTKVFAKIEKSPIPPPEKQRSLLTEELKKHPEPQYKKFLEYGRFDGTRQTVLLTKSYRIFMTMLDEKLQNYPLYVCIISTAKIRDLIGFCCYKCSIEHPTITLGSVDEYGLCLAEDDGEVDWIFPCLDADAPITKFGFSCLGLIELKKKKPSIAYPLDMHFPTFPTFSEFTFNEAMSRSSSEGSHTSETVKKALKAVSAGQNSGAEKACLSPDVFHFKTFKVNVMKKILINTSVLLNICMDNIEIEPIVTFRHMFWARPKYFIHRIATIAACETLVAKRYKTSFRIVYGVPKDTSVKMAPGSMTLSYGNIAFKFHDFKCDSDMAKEIITKINAIVGLRNSPCFREYKFYKEKKQDLLKNTKRNFFTKR